MAEITKEQWQAAFKRVHDQYVELKRHSVLTGIQMDRLEHLRLMVNCYGSGKRTQKLYEQMNKAVEVSQ